jgi:hypothetical protein
MVKDIARSKVKQFLITALERKEQLESLRIRIDWQRSVFLLHPETKEALLKYRIETQDKFAITCNEQQTDWYLFGIKMLTDPQFSKHKAPELLVALEPSKTKRLKSLVS